MLLLGAHGLNIVLGTEREPAPGTNVNPSTRYIDYNKRKDTAASLIWGSLASSARQIVNTVNRRDPYAVWNVLKDRFDLRTNNIAAARIKRQFNLEKWNDKDTLSTWYGRFLSYQTKLQGSAKAIDN